MLNLNKYNIYKFCFILSVTLFGLSFALGYHNQQEKGPLRVLVYGGMSASLVLFALGWLTWLTGRRSPKRAQRVTHGKASELLDKVVRSPVGSLLTNAPKGVAVRISELIKDLDITEQPTFENLLDKVYRGAPACVLPRIYSEADGRFLNWYQYDVCITAAKEDLGLADKITKALLDRHPGCRIYLDVSDGVWLKSELIKKVFYASSWKCVALLSKNMVEDRNIKDPGRELEIIEAMRRDQYESDDECRNYLLPIPLDEHGLEYIKTERFLGKHAKSAAIIQEDQLCKMIVDTLSEYIRTAPHYDHLADIYMKNYEDEEILTLPNRFAIALSFPSERQAVVQAVVEELGRHIPREEIFYYPHLHSELSGKNLHAKLQSFYRSRSELVAVFLCSEYASSLWCRWEWWMILKLLHQQSRKLMLLRFDKAPIPRLPHTYGYVDCEHLMPREIAGKIVQRLLLNRQQQPPEPPPAPD